AVDVNRLVRVHDPDGGAGGVAGDAARAGVAAGQGGVVEGVTGEAVAARPVGAAIVGHVELRRVALADGTGSLPTGDGRADGVRQGDGEILVRAGDAVVERLDQNRLGRQARREGERSGGGGVVGAGQRRAVGGRVIDGHRRGAGGVEADGKWRHGRGANAV